MAPSPLCPNCGQPSVNPTRPTSFLYLYHTDQKENELVLIYEEIQMISVANSYMRKGFLMYKEMRKYIRRPLKILSSQKRRGTRGLPIDLSRLGTQFK
jgi:hypothetical protein